MISNTAAMSQNDCGSCRACRGMLDPSATFRNENTTLVFTVIGTFAANTVLCMDKFTFKITQNTNTNT